MDVSIVAALSSFIVSERVIKAKATVLIILLGVVGYDLSIPTNNGDPSSLRVYRGPALIAIAIISTAFSLRTWRRNGVACDELLFLPGTRHAEKHGIYPPEDSNNHNNNDTKKNAIIVENNDGFIVHLDNHNGLSLPKHILHPEDNDTTRDSGSDDEEFMPMLRLNNSNEDTNNNNNNNNNRSPSSRFWCMSMNQLRRRRFSQTSNTNTANNTTATNNNLNVNGSAENHHHRIHRHSFMSRYFASTKDNDDPNLEYAPSGPSVASAALDLFLPVLFNFHIFTMAATKTRTTTSSSSDSAPPQILPMIFLSILILRCIFPLPARRRFWKTLRYTVLAPYYTVTFRDEFIGDLFTSLVRPLQDICFAMAYYLTCWYTVLFSREELLKDVGDRLQQNRLLHNVLFPICAILPMTCKFLQTLRQAYCTQRRWPHYGNAFKYLSASIVVYYAMVNPEGTRSHLWLCTFLLALFYQIWWDIFIDWELLVIPPSSSNNNNHNNNNTTTNYNNHNNNATDNSAELIRKYNNHKQNSSDEEEDDSNRGFIWKLMEQIPTDFELRSRRLYKSETYYWRILWINVFLRFTWMVAFIPTHRLNESGQINYTFSTDVQAVGGFIIALAEIIRRCCWGILKVELETIKMTTNPPTTMETTLDFSLTGLQNCFLKQQSQPNQQPERRISNQYLFLCELGIWLITYIAIVSFFFLL